MYLQGTPEYVENSSPCQFTFRWESASACPTSIPTSPTSETVCTLSDPYANDLLLDFSSFVRNLTLVSPDRSSGSNYSIHLCGTTIHSPADGCDSSNTGVCRLDANGGKKTLVYANHTFSLVSHSPRVVEVSFHEGADCTQESSSGQRTWTALVQMICSNQSETAVPVFVSDEGCELRFVWRNQSFCAGESAAKGCVAVDRADGYVFSLDGLLAQNWTVSGRGEALTSFCTHTSLVAISLWVSILYEKKFILASWMRMLLYLLFPLLPFFPPPSHPSSCRVWCRRPQQLVVWEGPFLWAFAATSTHSPTPASIAPPPLLSAGTPPTTDT